MDGQRTLFRTPLSIGCVADDVKDVVTGRHGGIGNLACVLGFTPMGIYPFQPEAETGIVGGSDARDGEMDGEMVLVVSQPDFRTLFRTDEIMCAVCQDQEPVYPHVVSSLAMLEFVWLDADDTCRGAIINSPVSVLISAQ